MRNKTSILVLTVVITAICLFYLSFSIVSRGINKDMLSYAEQQAKAATASDSKLDYSLEYKNAVKQYRDSIWNKEVYLGYTYKEVKNFELNLGLDLQGGIHITLIVSPEEIIKAMSGNNQDPEFLASISEAKQLQKTQQEKFTTLFYDSWTERKGEGKLWEAFLTSDNQSKISSKSTDKEILDILNEELDDAIDRTMIVLRSRIDKFGATQPIIQAVKSTGRIEIQLPGVDDEERIINQVKAVAKLEFLEVWTPQEISPYYQAVNDYLVSIKDIEEVDGEEQIEESEKVVPSAASADLFADDTTEETNEKEVAADSTEENDGLFANNQDTSEEKTDTIQQNTQFPITEYFTLSQYGLYAKAADYDKIEALMNNPDVEDILPSNMKLLWGVQSKDADEEGIVPVYFVKKSENGEAPLTGEVIVDARQDYDSRGQVAVSMQMNVQGAKAWERLTEANQNRQVAVVLDNMVFSAPVVNEAIPNGNSSISGNFSVQEAVDLANILKAGKLPAPTEIERMVVVGPSLGKESIDRGLMSLGFGFGFSNCLYDGLLQQRWSCC